MGSKLKLGAVVIGAMIVTALGIDAADTLQGNSGTMLGQLVNEDAGGCGPGMVSVAGETFSCIDAFEASAGDSCPVEVPANQFQTNENVQSSECQAVSQQGVVPWRFISREQAAAACARAGKRLPTALEWYQSAVGFTDSTSCNIDSRSVAVAGASSECRSPSGAFDQVGNVWEWVADDVIEGRLANRELPPEGFVAQVDRAGIATKTGTDGPDPTFDQDYFWSEPEGAYAIIRGGYYGSETDAGIYAVHAHTLPTMAGTAIGFRCVK